MIGRQLDDIEIMEQWVFKECSNIDYTFVRPPRLLDTPLRTDAELVVRPDAYFFEDGSNGGQLSRANVAKFMLDEIEKNEYIKKGVAIDFLKSQ
jgi:putative NADH-flavin reductase